MKTLFSVVKPYFGKLHIRHLKAFAFGVLCVSSAAVMATGTATRTCTWTGGGHDGSFKNAANWEDGIVPEVGVTNEIWLAAQDEATIFNDIGPLVATRLHVWRADGSSSELMLDGSAFELTNPGGVGRKNFHVCALSNGCPLTIKQPLTFSATASSALYHSEPLTLDGVVTVLSDSFMFAGRSDTSNTTTLNSTLTAKDIYAYGKGPVAFNRPVSVRTMMPGRYDTADVWNFYSSGNEVDDVLLCYYGAVHARVANAFPSGFVFRWWTVSGEGGYPTTAATSSNDNDRYLLYADQVCDRIESDKLTNSGGRILFRNRISSASGNPVLTLKGTSNALSYGVLESKGTTTLSVVWDPVGAFTQTFVDQRHTMAGELVVRGGILASSGTNSFSKVTALRVMDGAKFAVVSSSDNAAVNPFSGTTDLFISGTGAVEVPSGVTMTVQGAMVKGVLMSEGTYQALDGSDAVARKVAWVTGGGLVSVAARSGTSWAAAEDGDWGDAENWSHGLPSDASPTYVAVEGAAYKVTMKNGDAWPRTLVIHGSSATVAVGEGQSIEYNGSGKTASLKIEDGGALSVEGNLVLTNYVGTFAIGSSDTSVTSRFVVSGTALYAPATTSGTDYRIDLNAGGSIDQTGGTLSLVRTGGKGALRQNGGGVQTSGDAIFCLGSPSSSATTSTSFGPGDAVFAGQSVVTNSGKACSWNWGPQTAGESLSISFCDQAAYRMRSDNTVLGTTNGTTILEFDSDVEHNSIGYRLYVRAIGTGIAELCIKKGKITVGERGLDIGDDNKGSTETHGRFALSGGWLYNKAVNGSWTDCGDPNGFSVGYGANATVSSGTIAYGEVYQSGGTNQNVNGTTLVGIGYGSGTVVQACGTYWHDSTSQAFGVGAAGGEGLWIVSNGTLRVKANAYVGGFHTNILTRAERLTRWPDSRHDAKGSFVAAGGLVEFQKDLVLGADGCGTVEVVGSEGSIVVGGALILSNHVANVASGGTLNFICDANGVKPLVVMGHTTFLPGAKMTVDVSGYTGVRPITLLTAAEGLVNPIAPEEIVIVDNVFPKKHASVRLTANGYSLHVGKGLCIIVR